MYGGEGAKRLDGVSPHQFRRLYQDAGRNHSDTAWPRISSAAGIVIPTGNVW